MYVTLQATTEHVAKGLRARGVKFVRPYHAGLNSYVRADTQQWFLDANGRGRVMVATIAFGMGLEKADVLYIYHWNLSKSLDGWQQEIGRAGRDGKPSICETLVCVDDVPVINAFARGSSPTLESVRTLVDEMFSNNTSGATFGFVMNRLASTLDMRPNAISQLICDLEIDQGLVEEVQPYCEKIVCRLTEDKMHRKLAVSRRGSIEAQVLSVGKEGSKTLTISTEEAAKRSGILLWKVQGLLNGLQREGYFTELKGQINKQRVQILKPIDDPDAIAHRPHNVLLDNEKLELELLDEVLTFFRSTSCHRKVIAKKYGDPEPVDDCSDCEVCAMGPTEPNRFDADLGSIEKRPFDEDRWPKICLAPMDRNPLVLARVASGITSPLITKMRYRNLPVFGSMTDIPYEVLLARARKFCLKR